MRVLNIKGAATAKTSWIIFPFIAGPYIFHATVIKESE